MSRGPSIRDAYHFSPSTFHVSRLRCFAARGGELIVLCRISGLESAAGEAALSDDGLECADSDLRVVWNRHCHSPSVGSSLYDDVTAPLSDDLEAMLFEDAADLSAREDTELTHAPLQSG